MRCPQCDSDNVQRIEMVYQAGTTRSTNASNTFGSGWIWGTGQSRGRLVTGSAATVTTTTERTNLAARLAPPIRPLDRGTATSYIFLTITGLVIIGIALFSGTQDDPESLGCFLAFWGTLALMGLVFIVQTYQNAWAKTPEEYDQEYNTWKETWICHACGYQFREVATNAGASLVGAGDDRVLASYFAMPDGASVAACVFCEIPLRDNSGGQWVCPECGATYTKTGTHEVEDKLPPLPTEKN